MIPQQIQAVTVLNKVTQGRETAIIIDDLVDTSSTLMAVANILHLHHVECIWAICTHALCSKQVLKSIVQTVGLEKFMITNTLPHRWPTDISAIDVINIIPRLASAINEVVAH